MKITSKASERIKKAADKKSDSKSVKSKSSSGTARSSAPSASNGNSATGALKADSTSISKEAKSKDSNSSSFIDRLKTSWLPWGDDNKDSKPKSDVGPGDSPSSFEVGDIDYYLKRKEDFEARNPGKEAPDYYEEYGDRYVREFDELSPELSEDGQEWVTETRENLQEAFEERIAEDPEAFAELERDPEKLREWAFDSHSDAYLDAGFADLPAEDILKIATTPRFEDFFDNQAIKEAVEVGVQAVIDNPALAVEVPAEALNQLKDWAADGLIDLGSDVISGLEDLASSALDTAGDVKDAIVEGAGDFFDAIPSPF